MLAAAALVLFCLSFPSAAAAARVAGPPPHYWGAWIGPELTGTPPPWDMSPVSQFEGSVGKGLSLIEFSSPFADCSHGPCQYYEFPTEQMQTVRDYGAIPFLSWGAQSTRWNPSAPSEPDFQLSAVIQGRHDSYIRSFAEAAREWGHPFFLRFDWEMNGNWFPWSEGVNGNQPGEFVAAWRHVHDIFTAVGATNATWVWCPYADPSHRFLPLRRLYPGNAYVDWTCVDGFNWGANPANPVPWTGFDHIFSATYRQITKRLAPRKPMLLAEFGSTGQARAKAAWIRNMFRLLATRYRRIRGLIWFDKLERGIDFPLAAGTAPARAFSRGIRRGYRPNIYRDVAEVPIHPPRRK